MSTESTHLHILLIAFDTDATIALNMPNSLSPFTKAQLELQPDSEERVAYMRKVVFKGWLQRFSASIRQGSPEHKILLLMDSAPGHLVMDEPGFRQSISNIEIVTLPKNSTSMTQPLDAGMIAVFKNYYQDFLAISTMVHRQQLLQRPSDAKRVASHIPNYIAWKHIVQAWNLVTPETVRHCFRHVPLFSERHREALSTTQEEDRIVEMARKRISLSIVNVNEKQRARN